MTESTVRAEKRLAPAHRRDRFDYGRFVLILSLLSVFFVAGMGVGMGIR